MINRVRVQLGDVTTPTGSGPGIFDQIKNWFTGSVANAASSPQIVLDWAADVKARGNVATRYPKTDGIGVAGDLAEKEADVDNSGNATYVYYPAPDDVINADRITRGLSALAPVTGTVAAAGQAAGETIVETSKAVLDVPRQAIAGALGVNPTVITAVALGVAGLWLYSKVGKRS